MFIDIKPETLNEITNVTLALEEIIHRLDALYDGLLGDDDKSRDDFLTRL